MDLYAFHVLMISLQLNPQPMEHLHVYINKLPVKSCNITLAGLKATSKSYFEL